MRPTWLRHPVVGRSFRAAPATANRPGVGERLRRDGSPVLRGGGILPQMKVETARPSSRDAIQRNHLILQIHRDRKSHALPCGRMPQSRPAAGCRSHALRQDAKTTKKGPSNGRAEIALPLAM